MKRITLTTAIFAACVSTTVSVYAEGDAEHPSAKVVAPAAATKAQATCPVMGGPINKANFVDVKGYRVYTCCRGCDAAISKEPDKYLKILADRGETVEKLKKDDVAIDAVPKG